MNQIDQIKDILFSNEKRALDALTRRLEKRDSRVADMADVLPESINRSHADGERLKKALRAPVEECITDSISRDPQSFADALFPVMGPAIRKSISESLKAFTQGINQAIEQKTSLKSIKWRFQAKKAGVPYAQFLINRSLEYRVDHAYLIQPSTGLLIADVHRADAIRKDDEAVSAMLTAIQDFVKESFSSTGDEGTLETADIGKYALWTMQGPHAMLACVITGVPPRGLRAQFMEVLELIHLQYAELLESFDSNDDSQVQQTQAIEPYLEDCLVELDKIGEDSSAKKGLGFVGFVLLIGLSALGWFGWQNFQLKQQANTLIETLESEPGIFLTQTENSKGIIHIKGLRDILALSPETLAVEQGITLEKLDLDFTPFYSLEKDIQLRRLQDHLVLPDGVEMQLTDAGELSFSGDISSGFKQQAEQKLQGMLGIKTLSFADLNYPDAELLVSANEVLQPPESLKLRVRDGVLSLHGAAPYAWHKAFSQKREQLEGLTDVNSDGLQIAELANIQAIENELNNELLQFSWRTRLVEGEESKIATLGDNLKIYGQLLEDIDVEPEIVLTGFTDNTGSEKQNSDLQMERALYIKGRLVGQGVRSNWIFVRAGSLSGEAGVADPSERKIVVSLAADLSAFN